MSNGPDDQLELDDYGARLDGAHNLWIVRLVAGPATMETGRVRHGGQIAAKAVQSRSEAELIGRHWMTLYAAERSLGARVVVEPGFYSRGAMPGAKSGIL